MIVSTMVNGRLVALLHLFLDMPGLWQTGLWNMSGNCEGSSVRKLFLNVHRLKSAGRFALRNLSAVGGYPWRRNYLFGFSIHHENWLP